MNEQDKVAVLVVDDAALIRQMFRQILTKTEFVVVGEAADGEEAVSLYLAHRPHIVLMDIIMPGSDGIEAVKQIIAADPNARVVMCSALGNDGIVMEALAAGASDFIVKPFVRTDVLETLSSLL